MLRAYPSLGVSAKIKSVAEDFIVEEQVPIEFSGEGEHCWLYIQKRECNTDWVAQKLADFCGVKRMAVSYAGLKDRHAVTSQWFSVHLPGKPTPDWQAFASQFLVESSGNNTREGQAKDSEESISIIESVRHNRKLQRGALKGNRFCITLRDLSDSSDHTFNQLQQRCEKIASRGVPNYFGDQRFGRACSNLEQAEKMFQRRRNRLSKHKRGLYLSAARSWLFNRILCERVARGTWDKQMDGDAFMLDGRSACFRSEVDMDDSKQADSNADEARRELDDRLIRKEIHPTAILWGEGDTMVSAEAKELEMGVIDQYRVLRDGLVAARVKAMRRACRVIPGGMRGERVEDNFVVCFELPAGSYASVVMAEIFSDLIEPYR